MPGNEQVNMADVARRAGVSIATVSRALRGAPGVSEPTRERIRQIATELAYVISPEASHLSRGATGRVAVVVQTINLWFYATLLAGVESVLREAEFDVLIYHVGDAADRAAFFERLPARRKADALIVIALPLPDEQARLAQLGMPVVVVGGRLGDYPHVRVDDVEVGAQAVSHLIGLGHERIAMMRSADTEGVAWPADRERALGYHTALEEAGLEVRDDYVVSVPYSFEAAATGMERLLSLRKPPTAVFSYSEELAMSALRTLRRAHWAVPGRMSVVGVDDHPHAALHDLTTVRQPVEELGRLAGRLVVDLLRGTSELPREATLPTWLAVRGTTGPPVD